MVAKPYPVHILGLLARKVSGGFALHALGRERKRGREREGERERREERGARGKRERELLEGRTILSSVGGNARLIDLSNTTASRQV